ncbi:MAG TPA: hypothetical protein VE287_01815, partial [Actinopolymorphaceae bacterium]|nr:hypothetical protein [Actinopolymorphaceae bacterium]
QQPAGRTAKHGQVSVMSLETRALTSVPVLLIPAALTAFSATPGRGSRHDGNVLLLVIVVSIALLLVVAGVITLYSGGRLGRKRTQDPQRDG